MIWSCSAVRRRLADYHDGELTMDQQVAVEGHLRACVACATEVRRLSTIGTVLRAAALEREAASDQAEMDGFAPVVVSRMRAEREESYTRTFQRMFEDLHLVWAALSATAATFACVAITLGICYFSRAERSDSLAALIEALSNVGSNEYPVDAAANIALPRQATDPVAAIPTTGHEEDLCALNATITREGRVSEIQLLETESAGGGKTTTNWNAVGKMLDSAAQARFEPARAGGSPVAVNMVWLLAHLTVRPKARGEVRAPVAPPVIIT